MRLRAGEALHELVIAPSRPQILFGCGNLDGPDEETAEQRGECTHDGGERRMTLRSLERVTEVSDCGDFPGQKSD